MTEKAASSDGSHFVIYSKKENSPNLYLVNIDGSVEKNLTQALNLPEIKYFLGWSGDSSHFALDSSQGLYIIALDGKTIHLTDNYLNIFNPPSWSPNSKNLVMGCNADKKHRNICITDIDGNTIQTFDYDISAISDGIWSNDSMMYAFSFEDKYNHYEVHVIWPETGLDKVITSYTYNGADGIEWSPDNQWLLIAGAGPAIKDFPSARYPHSTPLLCDLQGNCNNLLVDVNNFLVASASWATVTAP